ncbi:MAG: hypothetical protein OEY18_17385, partial [Candidatus Aminicenantes bacterium]|nr:hypothetical protein [Candidatus Aminicenantes bacterium]
YGYKRVGERELPKALSYVEKAKKENLQEKVWMALNLAGFAVQREIGALCSLEEIYSGSDEALRMIDNRVKQWEFYREGLADQVLKYGAVKALDLNVKAPEKSELTEEEKKYSEIFPDMCPDVKGKEFYLERTDRFRDYIKENPDALKKLKLNRNQQRSIQNFINGKRSVMEIRNAAIAETEIDLPFESLMGYLELLKELNWITF